MGSASVGFRGDRGLLQELVERHGAAAAELCLSISTKDGGCARHAQALAECHVSLHRVVARGRRGGLVGLQRCVPCGLLVAGTPDGDCFGLGLGVQGLNGVEEGVDRHVVHALQVIAFELLAKRAVGIRENVERALAIALDGFHRVAQVKG